MTKMNTETRKVNMETTKITTERQKTHGEFRETAKITQVFKRVLYEELALRRYNGKSMPSAVQVESVEMILTKISRIISGDANFQDHWKDIAGYAHLVILELEGATYDRYNDNEGRDRSEDKDEKEKTTD